MSRLLTPLEISEILHDLVTLLAAEGQAGSIFVIGGAAIALENPNRHTTRDIDGWLRTVDIEDAVQALSVKYGLDARWFDSEIERLRPPASGIEIFHPVFTEGAVTLFAANTDALLAMKLNIARDKDSLDLAYLLAACAVTSLDEAQRAYEKFYPGEALSDVAIARVDHALGFTN